VFGGVGDGAVRFLCCFALFGGRRCGLIFGCVWRAATRAPARDRYSLAHASVTGKRLHDAARGDSIFRTAYCAGKIDGIIADVNGQVAATQSGFTVQSGVDALMQLVGG